MARFSISAPFFCYSLTWYRFECNVRITSLWRLWVFSSGPFLIIFACIQLCALRLRSMYFYSADMSFCYVYLIMNITFVRKSTGKLSSYSKEIRMSVICIFCGFVKVAFSHFAWLFSFDKRNTFLPFLLG